MNLICNIVFRLMATLFLIAIIFAIGGWCGVDMFSLSVWWDILIILGVTVIYDFVFWYFYIVIYITFGGCIRYKITGVFQR